MDSSNKFHWYAGALLAFATACVFYAANSWVSGPAYLADEIGYLNNAAFIAGKFVDGASSYYAGYSFLIAPLFYFMDDPNRVWQGVLIVNAVMWGATVWLLLSMIQRLFPEATKTTLIAVAIVVVCYPANVVMSGYAFSQTAVAFVFALSVATFPDINGKKLWAIVAHAALVGFLYWVHPTGIVATAASLVAVSFAAIPRKQYFLLFVHAAVSVGMVVAYKYGIEPWRISGMTLPGLQSDLRYPSIGGVLSVLSSPQAWMKLAGVVVGQLSYAAVATFGLAILAGIAIAKGVAGREWPDAVGRAPVRIFILLAPLGCIAISALSSAAGNPDRLDHWVYGRYQDAFILPLLAYGLLSAPRKRWHPVVIGAGVYMAGLWLTYGLDTSGPVNRVNISGLWSEQFLQHGSIALWLAVGAVGIVLPAIFPRYLLWVSMIVVYCACSVSQASWHRSILEHHSNPSEVVDFVLGNFKSGCVYFDAGSIPKGTSPASVEVERASLYSFYFFNYRYIRHAAQSGPAPATGCNDVILTYGGEQYGGHAAVVGREDGTGLRVLVKEAPSRFRYPALRIDAPVSSYWISRMSEACLLSGDCFYSSAKDLSRQSQVGEMQGQEVGLATTGRDGYLFFGPHRRLSAGTYEVRVRGKALSWRTAYLDVVFDKGTKVVMNEPIDPGNKDYLAGWKFVLPQEASDIEIRLKVGERDSINVTGYSVVKVSTN